VVLGNADGEGTTPNIELLKNFWREEQFKKRYWHEKFYD
jgi:hypothetical protein